MVSKGLFEVALNAEKRRTGEVNFQLALKKPELSKQKKKKKISNLISGFFLKNISDQRKVVFELFFVVVVFEP